MWVFVSKLSYPTKLTLPSFTICQSSVSIAVAARERSFCCFNAASKPASSTLKLFSCAINLVRSMGKPKVSSNSKAASPFIFLEVAAFNIMSSIFFKPLSNVLKNASSSSFITFATNSSCAFNSGKTCSNCVAITGNNWCINGCL